MEQKGDGSNQKKIWKPERLLLLFVLIFFVFNFAYMMGVVKAAIDILVPFFYGMVIAYLICPLCTILEKLLRRIKVLEKGKLARYLSIFFALMFAIFCVAILIYMVVPQIAVGLMNLFYNLPATIRELDVELRNLVDSFPELQEQIHEISMRAIESLQKINLGQLFESVRSSVTGTVGTVYDIFIGIVFSAYLLGSREVLLRRTKKLLAAVTSEKWERRIMNEAVYADKVFSGFLIGKAIDSLLIGILAYILFKIFGFTDGLFMAVIVGVTNMIPFFGPFIGMIPCCFLVFMNQGLLRMAGCIVLIFVLQQFDGNYLGPRILGDKTGLSGLEVFFAITFFGALWGVAGMLFGVPLFAVIADMMRKFVRERLEGKKRKMQDAEEAEI